MKRSRTACIFLPALLMMDSVLAQGTQVTPEFGGAPPPTAQSIAKAASPELCRHGFSCATGNLWRQEAFKLTPKAGGSPYIIQISLPASAAPAAGYPVVYLMDASMAFGTLTDIAHYQELFFVPT